MLKEFVVLHYDGTRERKVIDYVEPPPTPEPEPAPTLEERITEQEAKQLRTDTALAELSILIANTIAPSAE